MNIGRNMKQRLPIAEEMAHQQQLFKQWQLDQVAIHNERTREAQTQKTQICETYAMAIVDPHTTMGEGTA